MRALHSSSFRVFDVVLSSDIELPELELSDTLAADFWLTIAPATGQVAGYDWFHHWYRDDEKTKMDSSIARVPGGYRFRFMGQADFVILEDCRRIVCEPCPGTPIETVRHLFLDHVLPRILGQRGELVVHASAVELAAGEGIAFVGKSGWGKSTLASSFRENGARFVGDDCLRLNVRNGKLIGTPAYGGARLWGDSLDALFPGGVSSAPVSHHNSKRRIGFDETRKTGETAFKALFFLQDPECVPCDGIRIETMSGASAMVELIKRSFLLDVKSGVSAATQFDAIGEILATRPLFYTLQYPRDYAWLPAVRQGILDTVSALEFRRAEKQASA